MLSETLSTGLQQYRIGPKIRALRLKKGLGLVQLGQHSDLSSALLSKIERGLLFPTLPTLLRIAMVFGVGLEHFFVDDERSAVSVTRKRDRLQLPDRADAEPPAYLFESLNFPVTDRKMEAYLATFPAEAAASQPHRHEGTEFIYVLQGQLQVTVEGEATLLDEGDAMHFDSAAAHSYARQGSGVCTAVVVVLP
jgi:quercetin dioxygenase-like cupin family protein/DNA-binding XRE family transcriptional regulator